MTKLEHIKHWHYTQECKYLGCEIYEAVHNNLPLDKVIAIVKDVDIDLYECFMGNRDDR